MILKLQLYLIALNPRLLDNPEPVPLDCISISQLHIESI
jgi:hypothetical protein